MGHTKFPTILSVVNVALTLGHGNAEVERGFSDSSKTVTIDRTHLGKASLNNIGITTDGLEIFGSLSCHVPITL